jgi:hypothetical protein
MSKRVKTFTNTGRHYRPIWGSWLPSDFLFVAAF